MVPQHMNIGIEALAIEFPPLVINSELNKPEYAESGIEKSTDFFIQEFSGKKNTNSPREAHSISDRWNELAQKYKNDPFLGVKQKHVLKDNESILPYACKAAHKALKAAGLTINDIDVLIVASMFPDHFDEGDSAYISQELGFDGLAWNLGAMCASPFVALLLAQDIISANPHKKIMFISAVSYSKFSEKTSRLSMMTGDGAAVFIAGQQKEGQGVLASRTINSRETCGVFFNSMEYDEKSGKIVRRINPSKGAGERVAYLFPKLFKETCLDFIKDYGISSESLDFFISYNATGWYSEYCLDQLGLPPSKTLDIYPNHGNISASSCLTTLYKAQKRGLIKENDLILIYNHGFTSNCVAMLMRWGDVALG